MSLSDSPAQVIAALLIANDAFSAPPTPPAVPAADSWPLYVSFLPETPDSLGAVYDTSGTTPDRLMDAGDEGYDHGEFFGVQVRVRAQTQPDAWAQADAVARLCKGVKRVTVAVGSNTYLLESVDQVGTPLFLGTEAGTKRRQGYSVNFLCTITQLGG